MSIQPIVPIMPLGPMSPTPNVTSGDGANKAGTDFAKFLSDALSQVNALQKNADVASLGLASGQVQDLSTVMVALEKASLSMSLTVSVRDKVLDAYNQVMRMQM
ncbi:flagellar hook-basal body complex protein FliE [Desulfosporosinus metallidurans]|uniref:Flagellar hook-basal body complex protein FliE n=1 Tax=Desulfosporosinus metallidurans TaxID=1888891 RepID=A0A1Q8R1N0_9FIRM|nr:flagellar hook-basal body complex protein FliE [Desulfosporosinus metallidurans]OLN33505.1 Flagellar hook-basal body complex protein FliE [Desulfosporosinus metallidurans]